MAAGSKVLYEFGPFRVDPDKQVLLREDQPVPITAKAFETLLILVRHSREVVSKDELMKTVWPDTFVEEGNLSQNIFMLRKALGDTPEDRRYIVTLPGRGYRFVAQVQTVKQDGEDLVIQSRSRSQMVIEQTDSMPTDRLSALATALPWKASWMKHVLPRTRIVQVRGPAPLTSGRRNFWALTAIAALLSGAALAGWVRLDRAQRASRVRSIAVLPLESLSGSTDQGYFAEGVTDEITTRLAQVSELRVISRTSAGHYQAGRSNASEVGRKLNVDALLEGTVERSENQVKVRVQLIEAASDRHLWAETYQRPLQNILQLESELAQDIASQIRVHMTPKEREHIAHTRAVNSEAFQDYLLGRHYWGLRNPDSLQQAVKYFQRAIDEDPDYALPYSGLADCYIVLPMLVGFPPPDEAFAKAREYAARALTLDDTLAEAHTSSADVNLYYKWDFAGAEREFRRALELSPNYATAHQWYGEYLTAFGRHAEALQEYERAEVLDPLSAIVQVQLANGYRQAGQNDEAIKHYRKALELDPKFASVGEGLSVTLWRQSKYRESIQALEVMCHSGEMWRALCGTTVEGMKQAYEAGDKRAVLQKRMEFHKRWVRPDYYVARDYAELENVDMALHYLNQTYERHDPELFSVITDPEFDFMRSDPRFLSLVQRLKNPSPAG